MKQRNDSFLQDLTHVDHHIPAADHVDFRERRVFGDVLLRKDTHVTNRLADLIFAVDLLEVSAKALRTEVHCDALRINAKPGAIDNAIADIGRKNLYLKL